MMVTPGRESGGGVGAAIRGAREKRLMLCIVGVSDGWKGWIGRCAYAVYIPSKQMDQTVVHSVTVLPANRSLKVEAPEARRGW